MVANYLESKISSVDAHIQEPLLQAIPRKPNELALWTVSAVVAAPLAMAAGFVVTAEAANGAYALPFIAFGVYKILRDCFCA